MVNSIVYKAPRIKVITLSASSCLCDTSITIPGYEEGGEWPDE